MRSTAIPREIPALAGVAFCVALGFGVVTPAIPLFAQEFGVGPTAAGAVVSAFAFMRLVFGPFGGRLVDRLGERTSLVAGLALVAVSSLLAGLSQNYPQLLVLRAIGGIGSTVFTVASMSLVIRVAAAQFRGRATSIYQSGFLLGGIVGPAAGGAVLGFSLRAPFFAYAATLGLACVVTLVFISDMSGRRRSAPGDQGQGPGPEALSAGPPTPDVTRARAGGEPAAVPDARVVPRVETRTGPGAEAGAVPGAEAGAVPGADAVNGARTEGRSGEPMRVADRPGAPAGAADGSAESMRLRDALRMPEYHAALAANLAVGFSMFGLRSALVPLLVVEQIDASVAWVGWSFFVSSVAQTALMFPAGKLVDRIGRRLPLLGGALLTAVGLAMLGFSGSLPLMLAAMVVLGVGGAFLGPVPGALLGDVVRGRGGTVVAVSQMTGDVGAVLGPLVAGVVAERVSFAVAFGLGAAVVAAAGLFALLLPARPPESDALEPTTAT